jgi:tRNA-splicing ligase RtcB
MCDDIPQDIIGEQEKQSEGTTLIIFGKHDDKTLAQLEAVAQQAKHVALMSDGHLGYIMPIGGVAAYDNLVSVVGVGFDIGCGNCAIQTNLTLADFTDRHGRTKQLNELAREISTTLSFGVGRSNKLRDAPVDHGLFESTDWDAIPGEAREFLRERARIQLGTVGGGNHYVDVFVDEESTIWVGVHFGSRGFGHNVASGFLALGQGSVWGERVPERETLFALDSELGERYWAAMQLAGQYAYVGREYVARKVVQLMGAQPVETVHNHHNFAWKETHFGEELIVVRKGATPAYPGQRGFVGGSMGDDAYIIQGALRDDDSSDEVITLQQQALFSTVHGAGRVMSRSKAKGSKARYNKATGERRQARDGAITHEMLESWVKAKGVIVIGGDVDEAPQAYRRLDTVIAAQQETIDVLHTLRPLIVVMAGANVVDPYKD